MELGGGQPLPQLGDAAVGGRSDPPRRMGGYRIFLAVLLAAYRSGAVGVLLGYHDCMALAQTTSKATWGRWIKEMERLKLIRVVQTWKEDRTDSARPRAHGKLLYRLGEAFEAAGPGLVENAGGGEGEISNQWAARIAQGLRRRSKRERNKRRHAAWESNRNDPRFAEDDKRPPEKPKSDLGPPERSKTTTEQPDSGYHNGGALPRSPSVGKQASPKGEPLTTTNESASRSLDSATPGPILAGLADAMRYTPPPSSDESPGGEGAGGGVTSIQRWLERRRTPHERREDVARAVDRARRARPKCETCEGSGLQAGLGSAPCPDCGGSGAT